MALNNPTLWLELGLGLGVLALLIILIAYLTRQRIDPYPYTPADALFTPAERAFLSVLDRAVGAEHRVFGKVRIADLARPQKGMDYSNHLRALNRVAAKHLDYVVCRTDTLAAVCAVELNDRSHQNPKRQARDVFVQGVCHRIGLPLLQIPAQRQYNLADIRAQFFEAITPTRARPRRRRA